MLYKCVVGWANIIVEPSSTSFSIHNRQYIIPVIFVTKESL